MGAPRRSEVVDLLAQVPLFSNCTRRDLHRIARIVKETEHAPGKEVCREGELGVGLHVLTEGTASVSIKGKKRATLKAGDFFGELAILDSGPRSATVVAETPVKTIALTSWELKSLLKEQPTIALAMLDEVGRRLRRTDAQLSD